MDTLVSQYPVDPLTSVGNHRTCACTLCRKQEITKTQNERIMASKMLPRIEKSMLVG